MNHFSPIFHPFLSKQWFLIVQAFENTMGKGEIARNKQFLLFPQCISTRYGKLYVIFIKFELVVCKFFEFGKV